MKERLLKYSLYIFGCLALIVFVLVRLPQLPEKLLVSLDNYGDLYRLNYVQNFKEELPVKKQAFKESEKQSTIEEADIIIFGDSFFNYRRHKSVPERIADSLLRNVHFAQTHFVDSYLAKRNYNTNQRRLLIFEIAERGIPFKFSPQFKKQTKFQFNLFNRLDTTLFAEKFNDRYKFLLERSVITHDLYSALNTFHFNSLKLISTSTPKYSVNPPWLFYKTTVNNKPGSYNYPYRNSEIEFMANNASAWSEDIAKKYNVDILLVFIPNKSSLYHKKIGDHGYNNFMNRFSAELYKQNVWYINLYEDFVSADKLLFYPSDTHWNEHGETIAARKIISEIKMYSF